jgi:hypothetical protein
MFKGFTTNFDELAFAIAIWMCMFPLLGLLVIPIFGLQTGLIVALGLFIATHVVCRRICTW